MPRRPLSPEYREAGSRHRRGGASSLNTQIGDGDPDEAPSCETPERSHRDRDPRYFAFQRRADGSYDVEPVGHGVHYSLMIRVRLCDNKPEALRCIRDWQRDK